ncbi:MAG: N-acetyltransferase [Planctomycetota bacterium]
MSAPFVPADFAVPTEFFAEGFRLEPLGPEHNARDHQAWMSSIEHIHATPGFPFGNWPYAMDLAANLADLEKHAQEFVERLGFTYSVLDGDDVIGCLYIYPCKDPAFDARVRSWVTTARAEMDDVVRGAVYDWLRREWPFERLDYAGIQAS